LPRLGVFPQSFLDRSQFWLLPLPAPLGPLLAALELALFHGPLHLGVPRLGSRVLGRGGLLLRDRLYRWSCGL
jgi:hypothetical protein